MFARGGTNCLRPTHCRGRSPGGPCAYARDYCGARLLGTRFSRKPPDPSPAHRDSGCPGVLTAEARAAPPRQSERSRPRRRHRSWRVCPPLGEVAHLTSPARHHADAVIDLIRLAPHIQRRRTRMRLAAEGHRHLLARFMPMSRVGSAAGYDVEPSMPVRHGSANAILAAGWPRWSNDRTYRGPRASEGPRRRASGRYLRWAATTRALPQDLR